MVATHAEADAFRKDGIYLEDAAKFRTCLKSQRKNLGLEISESEFLPQFFGEKQQAWRKYFGKHWG